MIQQLNPGIDVLTNSSFGDGEAIMIIDYGPGVNTVWVVRHEGGIIKHYYSDDIKMYGNPMDGKGFDVDPFPPKKRPRHGPGAKRHMNFPVKKPTKKR